MDPLRALLGRDPATFGGNLLTVMGSGGKTTLITFLAREFAAFFPRVLVSTSTKVYPFPGLPVVGDPADLPAAFASHGTLFLGRRVAEGKLAGPSELHLEKLRGLADLILLECDGARGRPLKVHLPHDPPVPEGAGLALMLVGASALGRPADAASFHRAPWAPSHWGIAEGDILDAARIRRVLLAPDGYLGKTGRAPTRILVNQADAHPAAAAELTEALAERWPGPLLSGSALAGEFSLSPERGPRPGLILAAAGRGDRFGGDKRRFGIAGHPLLHWTLGAYAGLPLRSRCAVLGPGDGDLAAEVIARGWQVALNPDPAAGLSGSWRAGLAELPADAEGALLALGDMPALRRETLRALLAAVAADPRRALRPVYGGEPGHPVYLPRAALAELAAERGDRGARELLPGLNPFHLDLPDPGVILDLDHPDQAAALAAHLPEEPEFHAV